MVKKIYVLLLVVLVATQAKSQDDSIFERINGVSFKGKIFIRWNDAQGKLEYATDDTSDWYKLDEGSYFNIRNQHKNNTKTFIAFYNPLRFTIKSSIEDVDDTEIQAVYKFINDATVKTGVSIPANPALKITDTKNSTSVEIKQSILLKEWIYALSQSLDKTAISNDTLMSSKFKSLADKINGMQGIEEYLFKSYAYGGLGSRSTNEWIKFISKQLYDTPNDLEKFNISLETAASVQEEIDGKRKLAEANFAGVLIMLKDPKAFESIIIPDKLDNFKEYTASTVYVLEKDQLDKFAEQKKRLEEYDKLLTGLKAHVKKFSNKVCDNAGNNCQYYSVDQDMNLDWKSQKMKKVKYQISKIQQDGTPDPEPIPALEFFVAKKLALYPFISTGILYTNFSYQNYAIAEVNGANTIGRVADTKVNLRPALFLNCILFNAEPFYPFIQLGISTGVNDAIFPIGLGATVNKSFSISFGPMIGYRKELTNLKEGQAVKDEVTLKADLSNQPILRGYFSVNFNLGKK